MAFTVDARYFDQFPLIFDSTDSDADVVGMQHPQNSRCGLQQSVRDLVNTRYGDVPGAQVVPPPAPLGLWWVVLPMSVHIFLSR